MAQTNRSPLVSIVGIMMILLAVLNVAATFAVFEVGGPQNAQPDELGAEAPTVQSEVVQDLGGMTSPMGMATLFLTGAIAAIGIALLLGRAWEMFGMLALGADATLKVINIISQLATGNNLLDASVVPLAVIVVEVIGIALLFFAWNNRKKLYDVNANA
jgi:hypothetical protein